jgi:hypothetical protein
VEKTVGGRFAKEISEKMFLVAGIVKRKKENVINQREDGPETQEPQGFVKAEPVQRADAPGLRVCISRRYQRRPQNEDILDLPENEEDVPVRRLACQAVNYGERDCGLKGEERCSKAVSEKGIQIDGEFKGESEKPAPKPYALRNRAPSYQAQQKALRPVASRGQQTPGKHNENKATQAQGGDNSPGGLVFLAEAPERGTGIFRLRHASIMPKKQTKGKPLGN